MNKIHKRILSFVMATVMVLSIGNAFDFSMTAEAASVKQQISSAKRQKYTGFKVIGGYQYYFTKGNLAEGIKSIKGKKYYFSRSGKMAKSKLITEGKDKYYFNKHGAMTKSKLISVKGNKYYLAKNGKAKKNGFLTQSGKTYYFTSSGANKNGILKLGSKRYYFDSKGVMKTGFVTVSGKRYYFVKGGTVYNGFKTISKSKYYITSAGYVETGLKTINGKKYYFDSKGVMLKGLRMISGKTYYFNSSGYMHSGFAIINSARYYFDANGVMKTGYTWISGKLYYIETNGQIFTASSLKGWINNSIGERHFYTENGVHITNMVLSISGKYYAFDTTGKMEKGITKIGDKTYYFNETNGSAYTGWNVINNNKYHFLSNGVMDINLFKVGNYLYYSDDNGVLVNDGSGTITIGSSKYKQLANGAITEIWYDTADGSTYYFKADGVMAIGTVVINGFKSYFESNGKLIGDNIRRMGIDVSYHNGYLDWGKIKSAGVEFAILRAGYGMEANQKDKEFENNYKNAKAVGMPIGVYTYSYATTVAEAKKEAKVMKEWIKGKTFEYPIVFDIEDEEWQGVKKLSDKQRTDMIVAFCKEMEDAGYYVMVYANKNWLENYFDSRIKNYDIWLAQWDKKVTYKGAYGMWQYTSDGNLKGFGSKRFDFNYSYINYPKLIKRLGLNNL